MDADALWRFLTAQGKQVLLRRMTGAGAGFVEVKCFGRVRQGQPGANYQTEQSGGIAQIERVLIISNKEIKEQAWPAPPRQGDVVVMLEDGWTAVVLGCVTSELPGAGTTRYDMTLRGSG
jgi:hypothetical protein